MLTETNNWDVARNNLDIRKNNPLLFFSDVKVAVGQANGRISLLSFYAGGAAIKEFGPKSGRACNDLAWNPKFTNYLAAAYGKKNRI